MPLFQDSEDKSKKELGSEILDGIKFALSQYSKNGGTKVTLVVVDTKREPSIANQEIEAFGEDPTVVCVLGPIFSSELTEAALNGPRFKIPIISPTATGDELATHYNYVFQLNPSYEVRGKLMADYLINKRGFKDFAVIYEENYGENFRKHFEPEAKILGGKILVSESYQKDQRNIAEIISKITLYIRENDLFINAANLNLTQREKLEIAGVRWSLLDSSVTLNMDVSIYYMLGKNARKIIDTMNIKAYPLKSESSKFIQGVIDAIYIPIANPSEIGIIVPQLFSYSLSFYIAGTGDWNYPEALKENQVYIKNLVYESEYFPNEDNFEFQELKENLKKTKYKLGKNFLFGYDAMKLILNLIDKGNKTREDLNNALKNLKGYEAIKSKISLDYHGINSELNILRYEDGIKLVDTYKISR
ncbi:MAG: penicillin-binding protein activator [Chlorobi bacterium]|nr:penicillin-binding protein activator [Chlorobiota bacterium]MCI0716999.1 penicillin-binding protein activator [Chlorobiota bacterium]